MQNLDVSQNIPLRRNQWANPGRVIARKIPGSCSSLYCRQQTHHSKDYCWFWEETALHIVDLGDYFYELFQERLKKLWLKRELEVKEKMLSVSCHFTAGRGVTNLFTGNWGSFLMCTPCQNLNTKMTKLPTNSLYDCTFGSWSPQLCEVKLRKQQLLLLLSGPFLKQEHSVQIFIWPCGLSLAAANSNHREEYMYIHHFPLITL